MKLQAPKRSFSARLPSKMKLRNSKTKFSARLPSKMILRARIGSQATTKGTHHFRVTGVGFQAHLVTCDPIFFTSTRRNSEYGHKRPMSPKNYESQGGYFVLLMNMKALQGQLDQPYLLFWTGEATNFPESAAVASTLKHKHALVRWMPLSISWSSGMDVWLLASSCATWTPMTSKCRQPWWSMQRRSMIAWKLKFHKCKATEDPRLRSCLWNRKWMRWKRS